jgi:hypothetical protein
VLGRLVRSFGDVADSTQIQLNFRFPKKKIRRGAT